MNKYYKWRISIAKREIEDIKRRLIDQGDAQCIVDRGL